MRETKQEILNKLKFELAFVEQGGYGRSVRTPQKPTSIFQDSITCLNFGEDGRPYPCGECMLNDFVPAQFQNETIPCHHIPLDEQGHTLESLDKGYNHQQLEEAVVRWLKSAIARLESEIAAEKEAKAV